MTRAKTRTLSLKAFVGLVLASMSLVFAAGLGLGAGLWSGERAAPADQVVESIASTPTEQPPIELPPAPVAQEAVTELAPMPPELLADAAESRVLVDRVGELTGRMIKLETEAQVLASRISVISEFEARIASQAEPKAGPVAKTPPGAPSGGPWLAPRDELPRAVPDLDALGASDADGLHSSLFDMEVGIDRLTALLADLEGRATAFNLSHMSFPGRAPVFGIAINSGFGNRRDPFRKRIAFHSGVDFAAPKGTPIHASAGGKVIFSGRRPHYGLTVEVEHAPGLVTRYAHTSKLHVEAGAVVMPGQLIAEIGSTGRSTGPHLHFEILKDGRFVDPSVYLARF